MDQESVVLLQQCRSGDADAADRLYHRYVNRLLKLAREHLSPRLARRIDPEDVVQSAYRSFFVHTQAGEYVIGQSGDLWKLLAKIAMNKLLGQVEYHAAAKRAVSRESGEVGEPRPDVMDLVARDPSPEQVVTLADELEGILRGWAIDDRRIIELRLQDHTIEEIAATTGRPARTVRRVLARFKEALTKQWSEPGDLVSPIVHSKLTEVAGLQQRRSQRRRFDPEAPLDYHDFRIQRLIGTGGMGKVYAALQKSLDKPVAIKALKKMWLGVTSAIERFVGEARTAARLRHPNIVDVHGIGRLPGGGYFMVMDLVEGHDLGRIVRTFPPAVAEAAAIVATVADAIDHAHQRGVIHCDLKPGNVLVDERGRVFVTDFGLARSIDPGTQSTTTTSHIAGTVAFMAPEQIDASFGEIGPWTDVYGLGGILYVLLVGRPPLVGASHAELLSQVTSMVAPPEPRSLRPEIPAWLSEVCRRCLLKDPRARLGTAREVADALRWPGTA